MEHVDFIIIMVVLVWFLMSVVALVGLLLIIHAKTKVAYLQLQHRIRRNVT